MSPPEHICPLSLCSCIPDSPAPRKVCWPYFLLPTQLKQKPVIGSRALEEIKFCSHFRRCLSNRFYIIFSALSPASVTRNRRETAPATFTFPAPSASAAKIFQVKLSVVLSSHHPSPATMVHNFCLCFYSLSAYGQIAVHKHLRPLHLKNVSIGPERQQPKVKRSNFAEVCEKAVRYPKQKESSTQAAPKYNFVDSTRPKFACHSISLEESNTNQLFLMLACAKEMANLPLLA